MKKMILLAAMLLGWAIAAGAQTTTTSGDVKRDGDVFTSVSTRSSSADKDQPTAYKWRDSKGNEYQIILHTIVKGDNAGKTTCYVWRVSQKTGKKYKYFIPNVEKIAEIIIKENH